MTTERIVDFVQDYTNQHGLELSYEFVMALEEHLYLLESDSYESGRAVGYDDGYDDGLIDGQDSRPDA